VTQAVFLQRIVNAEMLRELVGSHTGLVHMGSRGDWGKWSFTPVLTPPQVEERGQRDRMVNALFGTDEKPEESIDVAELVEEMRQNRRAATQIFLRPRTKKALKEAVCSSPGDVFLEETSVFANEFEGWLSEAPEGRYTVVGPDPGRKRAWFAMIAWSDRKRAWIVE